MNKVTYHIFKPNEQITSENLSKLLSVLNELEGVIINAPEGEPDTTYLYYNNNPYQAKITFEEITTDEQLKLTKLPKNRIVIETTQTDFVTPDLLRRFIAQFEMRIYSTFYKCLLPRDMELIDCASFVSENHEKAVRVLKRFNLEPIFLINGSYHYYCKNLTDNTIHFVNDNLLYHFILTENDPPATKEMSFKVAEDIEDFVRKIDFGLVPTNFYEYYNKPFKILNFSGFNINNPGRKVFIKPYILEFDVEKSDFFKIAWDKSALLYMDKIRQGETLNDTILRILRNELKIADDYVGATVARQVEFDLDKNNVLTPRLVVRVYVEKANLSQEQQSQKDRTWISLDQVSS